MNLTPTPKPVSLWKRLTMAVVNSVLILAPVAVAMHLPVNMSYATPEHGAAAAQVDEKAQRQYDRAMEKCQALPAGTLPGGAVIDWTGARPTSYTEDPDKVDLAFRVALGETSPAIAGLNLCR